MSNPIRRVLNQCSVGFTVGQKFGLTLGALAYFIWPIDVLPDLLPPITYADDALVLFLAVRVLFAPTLPRRNSEGAQAQAGSSGASVIAATSDAETDDARRNCTVIDRKEA